MAGENAKCFSHSEKQSSSFLQTKYTITIHPAIALLGIYPREMKLYAHTKTYTQMFLAAVSLFLSILP